MAHRDEIEKAYMENLLSHPSGQWILRTIIEDSGCLILPGRDTQERNDYVAGRRDFGLRFVQRITKDFGWSAIDTIMKGALHVGAGTAGAGRSTSR